MVRRFVAALCLGSLSTASLISPAHGIIGGVPDTTSNNIVVRLVRPSGYYCSGTLVARTWVLTAAHCLQDSSGQLFGDLSRAVVATADGIAGRSSAVSNVLAVVAHPNYNSTTFESDIGLIQVNDVFGGVYAELATADEVKAVEDIFSMGIASGFGKTSQGGSGTSAPLELKLALLAQDYCRTNWTYRGPYFTTFVCTQVSNTSTTCSGDSGGPLFVIAGGTRRVAGVTSFGSIRCGDSYSVFTRVSSYQSFLQSYGVGIPDAVIPQLPALPPPSAVVAAPTLPNLPGTPSAPLPKFITTRVFQLVLEDVGFNRCLWDIDGPQTLRGYRVSIFLKKQSTKPTFRRILDEFGDATGILKLSCRGVRSAGVFITTESSGVRIKVPE